MRESDERQGRQARRQEGEQVELPVFLFSLTLAFLASRRSTIFGGVDCEMRHMRRTAFNFGVIAAALMPLLAASCQAAAAPKEPPPARAVQAGGGGELTYGLGAC